MAGRLGRVPCRHARDRRLGEDDSPPARSARSPTCSSTWRAASACRAGCSPGRVLAMESARAITTKAPPLSRSATLLGGQRRGQVFGAEVPGTRQGHAGVPSVRRARARRRALSSRVSPASQRSASRAMAWFRSWVNSAMRLAILIPMGRRAELAIEIGPLRLGDPGQVGKAGLGLQPLDQAAQSRDGLGESLLFALRACSARSPQSAPTAPRSGATVRWH